MMRTAKHHKRMRFLKAEMRFLRGALEMMCCCESAETLERLRTAEMDQLGYELGEETPEHLVTVEDAPV